MSVTVTLLEGDWFKIRLGEEEEVMVRARERDLFQSARIEKLTKDGDIEFCALNLGEFVTHIYDEIVKEVEECKKAETREDGFLRFECCLLVPSEEGVIVTEMKSGVYMLDQVKSYLAYCVVSTRAGSQRIFFFDGRFHATLFSQIKYTMQDMRSQWWGTESVAIELWEDHGRSLRYNIYTTDAYQDIIQLKKLEESVADMKVSAKSALDESPLIRHNFGQVRDSLEDFVCCRAVREWLQQEHSADLIINGDMFFIKRR